MSYFPITWELESLGYLDAFQCTPEHPTDHAPAGEQSRPSTSYSSLYQQATTSHSPPEPTAELAKHPETLAQPFADEGSEEGGQPLISVVVFFLYYKN